MRAVSSSVLNEFMRMKGTSTPYSELRCSIWRTDKSRKVMLSRTSMTDLGPTQPMVVPRPPLSLSTASLLRMDGSTEGRVLYGRSCLGLGGLMDSQSLACQHVRPDEHLEGTQWRHGSDGEMKVVMTTYSFSPLARSVR